jgi:glycosyltransferase involved in cell wall biosynthesis
MKFYHRIVRRVIIQRADASICVGIKGKKFLLKYGAKENAIFISPLAINNYLFQSFHQPFETKEFDIIFSGQLINRKMPFFVIDVLKELKDFKKDISILIIGSGPLEGEIINQLDYYKIKYFFPGFIQQLELPKYYANSKVLLFPSKDDPWGLVANEACAVGTPVITCLNTGVANDLIIHGFNGFVLPLIVDVWVDHVYKLLSDIELYNTFSNNSLFLIKKYSIENAVDGIKNAISYLLNNESN